MTISHVDNGVSHLKNTEILYFTGINLLCIIHIIVCTTQSKYMWYVCLIYRDKQNIFYEVLMCSVKFVGQSWHM